ncbi:hypothetical protein RFI_21616 [Reticulomyxa filosa]|uniref:WD-40 repeat protein n=1 Tax=Reticulomyxa filosa TaxID=46433 RepID=X6MP17_RETFI|nr:hypothetical protein RFI_21616 [Reticulomyxa filosa]|eukprot:ETO15748.1 hypothetical protein RFI_21616 [Reticulomyxa filosa]
MLKHQNHYMFSMDIQLMFGVLIFSHYKAITKMIIIMNNIGLIDGNGYTICSRSCDNTVRFWDIRLNRNQFCVIKGDDGGIIFLKSLQLKKNEKKRKINCGVLFKFKYLSLNKQITLVSK